MVAFQPFRREKAGKVTPRLAEDASSQEVGGPGFEGALALLEEVRDEEVRDGALPLENAHLLVRPSAFLSLLPVSEPPASFTLPLALSLAPSALFCLCLLDTAAPFLACLRLCVPLDEAKAETYAHRGENQRGVRTPAAKRTIGLQETRRRSGKPYGCLATTHLKVPNSTGAFAEAVPLEIRSRISWESVTEDSLLRSK